LCPWTLLKVKVILNAINPLFQCPLFVGHYKFQNKKNDRAKIKMRRGENIEQKITKAGKDEMMVLTGRTGKNWLTAS
jgi:hypothetical protein